MKKSGYIRFLYALLLFVGICSSVFILVGGSSLFLSEDLFYNNWSLLFPGWFHLYGIRGFVLKIALSGIWLWGVGYYGYRFQREYRQLQRLYYLNQPVADPGILERFQQAADRAGLKEAPILVSNWAVQVPFLKGTRKPEVVIPAEKLSEKEQILTFAHELVHCRRKDLTVRYFIRGLFMIYWFLPMKELWMEEAIELQETLCDIEVCALYGNCFNAGTYYMMILSLAENKGDFYGKRNQYVVSKLLESASQLERRIGNMSGYRSRKRKKWPAAAVSAMNLLLFILITVLGAFSADILFLEEQKVKSASEVGHVGWFDQIKPLHSITLTEENEFSLNTANHLILKPGQQAASKVFSGKETEKIAVIAAASESSFELALKSREEVRSFSPSEEWINLELDLLKTEYRLYVKNTGDEELEIELFCTY